MGMCNFSLNTLLLIGAQDNDRLFTEYFADREKLFTSAHLQAPPEPTEYVFFFYL